MVTTEPGVAGFCGEFRVPSWFSAALRPVALLVKIYGWACRRFRIGPLIVPVGVTIARRAESCPASSLGTIVLTCAELE